MPYLDARAVSLMNRIQPDLMPFQTQVFRVEALPTRIDRMVRADAMNAVMATIRNSIKIAGPGMSGWLSSGAMGALAVAIALISFEGAPAPAEFMALIL